MFRAQQKFHMTSSFFSDPNCLFCKIVAGTIPCKKISETDTTLAFLDIYPTSHGHALIIPKYHTEKLHELPADAVKDLGSELVRVSKAIVKATGCSDYNVLQNNGQIAHQVIKHTHFHIIPKTDEQSGLGVTWPSKKADDDKLTELQKHVTDALEKK